MIFEQVNNNINMVRLLIFFSVLLIGVHTQEYGYSEEEQKEWGRNFRLCGGRYQSPVEINSAGLIHTYIKPLEFFNYDKPMPTPYTLHNNGHTMNLTPNEKVEELIPGVSGSTLKEIYVLNDLHLHWGKDGNEGAEHSVDGKFDPLELHLVHRNSKYLRSEAQKYADGFAVLAIFLQISSQDNPDLAPIIDNLDSIRTYNASVSISDPFELRNLLKRINVERYYTYRGTLTTPPCVESVTWIVFSDRIKVSPRQLQKFRNLIDRNGLQIENNFRFLQPLDGRKIYVRNDDLSSSRNKIPPIRIPEEDFIWY